MSWFELNKQAVLILEQVSEKARALEVAAEQLSHCYQLDYDTVHTQFLNRERDGSTGFGRGVAIPHGKIPDVPGPVLAVLRIDPPIEYNSVDRLPVDIIFALISPGSAGGMHLQALAHISRLTRNAKILSNIRGADDPDAIYALVTEELERDAA